MDSTFKHLVLIAECQKNDFLKNADLQNLSFETLMHLVNQKNNLDLKVFPLKFGRVVLKHGLSIIEESFPKIKKYINSETLSTEPRLDEISFLTNENVFPFKPSLPLIIVKNVVMELFGSQLASISSEIIEKASAHNVKKDDLKIFVKNVESNNIDVISKDSYSDIFKTKPNLKRSYDEQIENDIPNKQMKTLTKLHSNDEKITILSDECLNRESKYLINTLNEPNKDVEYISDIVVDNVDIQCSPHIDSGNENNAICAKITGMEDVSNDVCDNISPKNVEYNRIGEVSSIYKSESHSKDSNQDGGQHDITDKLNEFGNKYLLINNESNHSDFESILDENINKINSLNPNLGDNSFLENFEKLVKPEEINLSSVNNSDLDDTFIEDLDSDDQDEF